MSERDLDASGTNADAHPTKQPATGEEAAGFPQPLPREKRKRFRKVRISDADIETSVDTESDRS